MNKMKYETPNFDFQDMKLTENIADTCWGFGYAFIDHDADPKTPMQKYWFSPDGTGCLGSPPDTEERLKALVNKFPALSGKVTVDDVSTNVKDSKYIDFDTDPNRS